MSAAPSPIPSLSLRQCLFAKMLGYLLERARMTGYSYKIVELYRSPEQQAAYVKAGKSKTLHSKHLDGLAVDLALFLGDRLDERPESFRELGEYWEKIGGRWGGRWGLVPEDYATKIGWDPCHFEFA